MKRMLIIFSVGLLSFGLGWYAHDMHQFADGVMKDAQAHVALKNDTLSYAIAVIRTKDSKKKTLRDYMSDEHEITWAPRHADTTSYMCEITLHKITALYWYHGQCQYNYFTYLYSDSLLEVIWSYKTDCILNMDFLEKSNGINKHPKHGDDFAAITLVNDTTLKVRYKFPEWIKKINEITRDSLFPAYYYLKREH